MKTIHRFFILSEHNEIVDWILERKFVKNWRMYVIKKNLCYGLWLHNEDAVIFKIRWSGHPLVSEVLPNRLNSIDAAAYYCPYVPLTVSNVIVDPSTFEPKVTFKTRYGTINSALKIYTAKDTNDTSKV